MRRSWPSQPRPSGAAAALTIALKGMRTLMYHDIAPRARQGEVGFPGPLAGRYKLDPDSFGDHLDALAATGLRVGSLDAQGSAAQGLLSFDDGGSPAPPAGAATRSAAAPTPIRPTWAGSPGRSSTASGGAVVGCSQIFSAPHRAALRYQ